MTETQKVYTGWDDDIAPGFLKAGFLGFTGTGKTVTAALLVAAIREHFKIKEPIAMFDTETGSGYLVELVQTLTGQRLLVKKARSFDDMMAWGKKLIEQGLPIGLADSVSHPWRELCEAYLREKNAFRRSRGMGDQKRLDMADWGILKPRWARWTDFYLNSPVHIAVCGRAGYEFDEEENEDGTKDLVKTGVKMKTEGEFGFEPSLLVQMVLDRANVKSRQRRGKRPVGTMQTHVQQVRRAIVLKDRFMHIDGHEAVFPSTTDMKLALKSVREFFEPHFSRLEAGSHAQVDTGVKTAFDVDDSGDSKWAREKREREILSGEVQGYIAQAYPGQTQDDKQIKGRLLYCAFGTYTWAQVENLPAEVLRKGLAVVVEEVKRLKGDQAPPAPNTQIVTKSRRGNGKAAAAPPAAPETATGNGHADGVCHVVIEGTQNMCTRDVGHDGDHRCSAGDVDEREELRLTAPTPARRSSR